MNIAVVDDISMEANLLNRILNEYAGERDLDIRLECFISAEELLKNYMPTRYTVIFMDIFMDGMSGIEAAEKIRETDNETLIVFLTGSPEYMADAFKCHAFDYIVKPLEKQRLYTVMDDILKLENKNEDVFLYDGGCIPYSGIISIISSDHYVEILCRDNTCHKPRMKFSAVLDILSSDGRFLQINRGVAVNMDYVRSFSTSVCVLENGTQLPVHTRNGRTLEQTYLKYIFDRIRSKGIERGKRI